MKTILGIDPGSRVAGYGIVKLSGGEITHCAHGIFQLPVNESLAVRLSVLSGQLKEILIRYSPDMAAVERIFLGKNADSAFKLGHARGVCLMELAFANVAISEYATREVKKSITGSGAATKEQVAMLIAASLKLSQADLKDTKADATDALALAYHHAVSLQIAERFARQKVRRERVLE